MAFSSMTLETLIIRQKYPREIGCSIYNCPSGNTSETAFANKKHNERTYVRIPEASDRSINVTVLL